MKPERQRPDAAPAAADRRAADDTFRICVVCSGNICRSPIAEQVLRTAIADAGLADAVTVSSAGTGDWHIGQGADPRAVRVLRAAGYPTEHRAGQITARDLPGIDLVLAADRGHLRELRRMTTDHHKLALLRSFDPAADGDEVPDPYYGPDAGFDEVLAMTAAAAPGVVDEIRRRLRGRRRTATSTAADAPSGTAPASNIPAGGAR